jgi:hypothetical protein
MRMLVDNRLPGVVMAKADDDIAQVFQALGLRPVALLTFRIRMVWTVYVDGGLAILIEEIRLGVDASM